MATSFRNGRPPDERVDEAVVVYLEAIEAGQPLDEQEWLARYPDLAAELEEFLRDQKKLVGWTEPLRELAGGAAIEVADPDRTDPDRTDPDCTIKDASRWSVDIDNAFLGDYELLDEIARGGMGIVYRARQVSLNRIVALKMILAGQRASADELRRFRMETEAAASLDHPHIMPIYEVGEHDGRPYFSMKLIEGGSLAEDLDRFGGDGPATARLLAQIARARCTMRTSGACCTAISSRPIFCSTSRASRTSPTSVWPGGSKATAG